DKLKLAVLFQMTYLGIPTIYYGDEIGMLGGRDPGCRHTMIWDTTKWNSNLRAWYRTMITMRNTYSVFRRGTVQTIIADSTKNLYAFMRRDSVTQAIVIINNSTDHRQLAAGDILHSENKWFDLTDGKDFPQGGVIDLSPRSGMVLISSKGK
ncbi:MAG TPA: alpha-amylase family glycosyl hydrolase, partial [Bacteroidota bacterium]|nr:alpha-amylase family glycosyl hydrolase [Bacteroidota bacterium]